MRVRIAFVTAAAIVAAAALLSVPTLAQPPGSPHETAKATVGGANISIEYGRPYLRGRKIMGGLVPYGRVWRTGADAATTLTTSKDLVIGGTTVPAGKVTLYTLPGEDQWKLILNKQTGQWGTEYDQSKDLARVRSDQEDAIGARRSADDRSRAGCRQRGHAEDFVGNDGAFRSVHCQGMNGTGATGAMGATGAAGAP